MKKLMRLAAAVMIMVLVSTGIPANASLKTVTVKTQSALDEILSGSKVYDSIKLKPDSKTTFKIGNVKLEKTKLYVNSDKATVDNSGVFKKITVNKVAEFIEKAVGNVIVAEDKASAITVAKGARVSTLSLARKGAEVSLNCEGTISLLKLSSATKLDLRNDGTITRMYIYKQSFVTVNGTPEEKTRAVIKSKAAGTMINTSSPVRFTVYGDAYIEAEAGAEGTSVSAKKESANLSLLNKTKNKITVKKHDGSKTSAAAGGSVTLGKGQAKITPTTVPGNEPGSVSPTPTPTPSVTPAPEDTTFSVVQKATDIFAISGGILDEDTEADDIKLFTLVNGVEMPAGIGIKTFEYANGTATVTMFGDLASNTDYHVRLGSDTATFKTVPDRLEDVVKIAFATSEVPVNENVELEFKYYGENDVDLTRRIASQVNPVDYDTTAVGALILTQKSGTEKAYLSGGRLYFTSEGDVLIEAVLIKSLDKSYAPVRVAVSKTVSGRFPKVNDIIYTITKDDGVYLTSREKRNVKHTIEMDDTVNNVFEALIAFSDGSYKTLQEAGYRITSGDERLVMAVSDSTSSGGTVLMPISTGMGSILIKDGDGKTVLAVEIEVRPARKPSNIVVTRSKGTLNANTGVGDYITITATVKDQYGDVVENPALTVTQKEATITQTGVVRLGNFAEGKMTITGGDVSITGKGNAISLDIKCNDNPAVVGQVSFMVKDIPYFSNEKYTKLIQVEGPERIDTSLEMGKQGSESTFVYAAFSKEGYFVREDGGRALRAIPTSSLKASDLGVSAGNVGTYFTIRKDSKFITESTANIIIDQDNIEFKPVAHGSKLEKGVYVIEYYTITAGENSSTVEKFGAPKTLNVIDTEPDFTYIKIADKVSASGTWGDKLSKFFEFYWNGEKIPASYIVDADVVTSSTSGVTAVKGVSFMIPNDTYGEFRVDQKLRPDGSAELITILD